MGCGWFSVKSRTSALHVRKTEVVFWIEQNWLQPPVTNRGKRHIYSITQDALKDLYRHHRGDLMKHRFEISHSLKRM